MRPTVSVDNNEKGDADTHDLCSRGLALAVSFIWFCLSCSFQMEPRTHGGSGRAARSTSTGAARGPGSRSAPAASIATAPTPSITATVTPTRSSGERPPPQIRKGHFRPSALALVLSHANVSKQAEHENSFHGKS